MKITASPSSWRSWHRLSIVLALFVGCDASQPFAPGSAGSSVPEDPMTAYRKTLPPVPESLKPFVAELEELAKRMERPPNGIPVVVLPGHLPYEMAEGGKLIAIDLTYTPVADAFLKKLQDRPALERINLTGTQITDEGLQNLGSQPALKELLIWGTQVSEDGAASFRESHPMCEVRGPDSSK